MKICISLLICLFCFTAVTVFSAEEHEAFERGVITTSSPCLSCHESATPGIVTLWAESKHDSKNVGCYACHEAKQDDPSGYDHNGFFVTAVPSPAYCASCHQKEVDENARTKHAWSAFFGPLKPYYIKARNNYEKLEEESAIVTHEQ